VNPLTSNHQPARNGTEREEATSTPSGTKKHRLLPLDAQQISISLITFNPNITAELLLTASKRVVDGKPKLLADGGVENFNKAVDELVDAGLLKRVLARTDITFSNSLIESWWRVLKHQWLFLNTLDTVSAVERLVAFYVQEHNTRLPHSAFHGQTPDEMYFGTGKEVPKQLETARQAARQARMEANRKSSCQTCEPPTEACS